MSWTLSPPHVFSSSEKRTAAPAARLAAARRVLDAGYKVGFHLDPMIAYPGAERDYLELLDDLFDTISPARISFISLGGLRMTPALRSAARRRHPHDPMLCGEEVLAPDGRYRTFTPLRAALLRDAGAANRRRQPRNHALPVHGAAEHPSSACSGAAPAPAAALGAALATRADGLARREHTRRREAAQRRASRARPAAPRPTTARARSASSIPASAA